MKEEKQVEKHGELNRFLEFTLGKEEYAIPLLSVREVIAMPEVTPIPHSPPYFIGIMNLRGKVISILDLRLKFGLKADPSSESVVVICDLGDVVLGVVVNSVNSVLSLYESDIQPKPDVTHKQSDYILGVTQKDQKLVLLLDVGGALSVKDYSAIKSGEKKAA